MASLAHMCWNAAGVLPPMLNLLQHPGAPDWTPFLGEDGWTQASLHAAGSSFFSFAGHICMKVIMFFDQWPLEQGKLVHPEVPQAVKNEVADDFWNLRECCVSVSDGCTYKVRQSVPTRLAVQSPEHLRLVRDISEMLGIEHKNGGSFRESSQTRQPEQWRGILFCGTLVVRVVSAP